MGVSIDHQMLHTAQTVINFIAFMDVPEFHTGLVAVSYTHLDVYKRQATDLGRKTEVEREEMLEIFRYVERKDISLSLSLVLKGSFFSFPC